jgi:hypothetical protein
MDLVLLLINAPLARRPVAARSDLLATSGRLGHRGRPHRVRGSCVEVPSAAKALPWIRISGLGWCPVAVDLRPRVRTLSRCGRSTAHGGWRRIVATDRERFADLVLCAVLDGWSLCSRAGVLVRRSRHLR